MRGAQKVLVLSMCRAAIGANKSHIARLYLAVNLIILTIGRLEIFVILLPPVRICSMRGIIFKLYEEEEDAAFLIFLRRGAREMRKLIRDTLDIYVCVLFKVPSYVAHSARFPHWRGHLVSTRGV